MSTSTVMHANGNSLNAKLKAQTLETCVKSKKIN
jgi:hypothetical protein